MFLTTLSLLLSVLSSALGFDNNRSDNVAVYWGQNSAGNQQTLSYYCKDDSIDAIPLAFLYIFYGKGGQPVIDFASTCNQFDNTTFSGTQLTDCSHLAPDIQACQAKGKIVTISLGGATGQVGFNNDTQAQGFADTIWNLFLGGTSKTRPFGSAVLDGVDLDIESGSSAHYAAFVTQIQSRAKGANKKYYVTAAPQCPYPDASIGAALNSASFDAVYIQFYNNYCGLDAYPSQFNYGIWDTWARNTSPNKNVKLYVGAPGSSNAAGTGYVNISTLSTIALATRKKYPTNFGGVMLWDASEAYTNKRYDKAIKQTLVTSSFVSTEVTSTSKTTTSTRPSSSKLTSTTKASSTTRTSSTTKASTTTKTSSATRTSSTTKASTTIKASSTTKASTTTKVSSTTKTSSATRTSSTSKASSNTKRSSTSKAPSTTKSSSTTKTSSTPLRTSTAKPSTTRSSSVSSRSAQTTVTLRSSASKVTSTSSKKPTSTSSTRTSSIKVSSSSTSTKTSKSSTSASKTTSKSFALVTYVPQIIILEEDILNVPDRRSVIADWQISLSSTCTPSPQL